MFDHNTFISHFHYSLIFWFISLSSEVVYVKYIRVPYVIGLFKGSLLKKSLKSTDLDDDM